MLRALKPVVNDATIAALEVTLEWARKGKIKGLALVAFHPDGQISTGVHGHWSHAELVFAMERMKLDMIHDHARMHGEEGR